MAVADVDSPFPKADDTSRCALSVGVRFVADGHRQEGIRGGAGDDDAAFAIRQDKSSEEVSPRRERLRQTDHVHFGVEKPDKLFIGIVVLGDGGADFPVSVAEDNPVPPAVEAVPHY